MSLNLLYSIYIYIEIFIILFFYLKIFILKKSIFLNIYFYIKIQEIKFLLIIIKIINKNNNGEFIQVLLYKIY